MLMIGALSFSACNYWDNPVVIDDPVSPPTNDERLNQVVPQEIRERMESWMPIYDGINPPFVEGVYNIEPMIAEYCSDRESGWTAIPTVIRFSNQNSTNNTLDYADYEGSLQACIGEGAFISGEGNNFSVYFNTIGQMTNVDTKTALVISGTKTSEGIANLYYAFVMVEKGSDPGHRVMNQGEFRIFKDNDGISETTAWNPPALARQRTSVANNEEETMYIFSPAN